MFSLYDHKRIPGGKKIISWDRCVFDSVSIVSKKEMSWYCSYFGLFPSFTIWEENKRCRAFSFVPVNFTRRHKPAASTNSRNWLRAFFFNFFGGNEHSLENKINVFFLEDCLIKPCMCMCSFLKILFCFVFVFLLNIWFWPRQGIWEMSPSTNICSSTETFPKHLPKHELPLLNR